MTYQGIREFTHKQADRTGVLLINLGTPDAPTPRALRKYLAEFLWDPRVVEIPRPLWWLILHGVILRTRPRKSAATYKKVWTDRGSPLLLETRAIMDALAEKCSDELLFEVGMRYGNPSIDGAVDRLLTNGARNILVLPLYPQYCGATTGSAFDALAALFSRRRWLPDLRFISHYHDFEPYIDACAQSIRDHWQTHGKAEKLILSFHGVPKRILHLGDPYFCECHKTSRLIAGKLGLAGDDYLITFQSRFGRAEWLQPYTDKTLATLASDGVKQVQVFCPGFAADCLETLEEIAMENRNIFLEAGGDTFSYIPALNASEAHIRALRDLIDTHLAGWPDGSGDLAMREERAKLLGAED